MSDTKQAVEAQGVFDVLSLFDKETIGKIKDLIHAIDASKIESILQMIETNEDGTLHLKIDLSIKK